MLAPRLLSRLACPSTHQEVALASPAELAAINAAIGCGVVRNVENQPVEQALEGALIRRDRKVAYEIRQAIPIMLIPRGLNLEMVGPLPS